MTVCEKKTYQHYTQPAFLSCVLVLAVAAVGMSVAIEKFEIALKKEFLPIKKSLRQLDESDLGPYEVISKSEISNHDILETLGTEEYIQWVPEHNSPTRFCSLFITYYGIPDRVPHVPEECYAGAGHERLSRDLLTCRLDAEGLSEESLKVRHLVFGDTKSSQWGLQLKMPILYLLSANGQYANERNDARVILNMNIFGKYSYFSKVEWYFFNSSLNTKVYPDIEQTKQGSEKLLSIVLPILETEHWPIDKAGKRNTD